MFDRGTADQLWLSDLGARPERWAVISADGRILTRKPQLEALKQANLYFVLFKKSFNQLGFEQQTIRLLTLWSPITNSIKSTRNPSVFEAPTSGKKLVLKSQTSVLA